MMPQNVGVDVEPQIFGEKRTFYSAVVVHTTPYPIHFANIVTPKLNLNTKERKKTSVHRAWQ